MAGEGRTTRDCCRRYRFRKVMCLIRGLCLAATARADHLIVVQQHIPRPLFLLIFGLRHEELGYGEYALDFLEVRLLLLLELFPPGLHLFL